VKSTLNRMAAPVAAAVMGAGGFCLRSGLYAAGLDHKNLLVSGHPLEAALWAFTAAMVLLVMLDGLCQPKYRAVAFGGALLPALGHILAGTGIVLTALFYEDLVTGPLVKAWKTVGFLCGPAFYWGAFCLLRRKRPFFGVYAVSCVFFALHLICHYQSWCADPQLQNYVFSFLGILLLMLLSYHRCAFCVSGEVSPLLRSAGMLAFYFCLTSLVNDPYPLLQLSCGLWALTGSAAAEPEKRKKTEEGDAL